MYALKRIRMQLQNTTKPFCSMHSVTSTFYNQGTGKYFLKQHDNLCLILQRPYKSNPNLLTHMYIAVRLIFDGRDGNVVDETTAHTFDLKNVNAYYYRALSRNQLHDYKGMLDDMNKALEIKVGIIITGAGRFGMKSILAIADLSKAISLKPDYVASILNAVWVTCWRATT